MVDVLKEENNMNNMPKTKIGIVAVSRDCFPESLSVTRREALIKAYKEKYDPEDIYECPVCIVESEIHMALSNCFLASLLNCSLTVPAIAAPLLITGTIFVRPISCASSIVASLIARPPLTITVISRFP